MTTAHTTTTTNERRKPTPPQLRYLRSLADQRGESFAMPRSASEAAKEIDRLKSRKRTPRTDLRHERRAISRDMAARGDAAQIRDDEITGYGSRATWNTDRASPREQPPSTRTQTSTNDVDNPHTELGRYSTANEGERIIYGQRIDGTVRLTDASAVRCDKPLVIESDLTSKAELDAIVADYLARAAALDMIPAVSNSIEPLET